MPVVSLEQAFESFGFSPAQASHMADGNREANGGMSTFGYIPDPPDDEEYEEYEEDEEDEVDMVEMAEQAQAKGDFCMAEKMLLLCYIKCLQGGAGLNVVKLRILVRLGEMYFDQKDWEKAKDKLEEAWKLWEGARWMADADRSIHPVSFLATWAECCKELGQHEEAEKLEKRGKKFDDQYSAYWDKHMS